MIPISISKNLFMCTFRPSLLLSASPHSLPLSSLFYFLPSASYFPSQADGRGWGQSAPVAMTPDSPCLVKARSFLCSISPELSTRGECVCVCECDSTEIEKKKKKEKKRRRQQVCASHVGYVKLQIARIGRLKVVCDRVIRRLLKN